MLKAAPDYIIIRMAKKEQEEKKGHIGNIIIPDTCRFMERNVQAGEITSIGERAAKYFPEAQVGHILLCHHFVQDESNNAAKDSSHLIDEDELFNYYSVTVYDVAGKGNETYGVWDGETIIPNKDYLFLEPAIGSQKLEGFENEDFLNSATTVTKEGIIVFKKWNESREEKVTRMQEIKKQIESLSKSDPNKPHIRVGIQQKEEELSKMSLEINEKRYEPYTVSYFNNQLFRDFNGQIEKGDIIYMLNIATQTHIEFMGKQYRVPKTNYIGFIYRPELEMEDKWPKNTKSIIFQYS